MECKKGRHLPFMCGSCVVHMHILCRNSHIFLPVLVDRQVNSAERASTNLLLYDVLVNPVDCGAIVFTVGVGGARMKGLFNAPRSGRFPTVMPQRTLVCRR